ncbi:MAG: M48 family metalloprotease [Burkholderiaceae bacterium]
MKKAAKAHARRSLVAAISIAICLTSALPAAAQLPSLGDGAEMSLAAELRIGERIAKEIYRDPDYLDDPVLAEYVQGIWQPLMAAARARGDLSPELAERFAWEVMLLRDRGVNAFALPGGFLGVNTGLINIVTSKDELASVLAHELSHVTQRHIVRLIANQGRTTPLLIGAMLLGILAASRSPAAANAMIVGGSAVAAQTQLNFSRDMEREADRVGFGVSSQAGFDPRGFASMFGKLQTASRINDNGSFPYLRSHPLTTERIADMQNRETQAGMNTQAPPMTLEHAMATARSRVLTDPGVDVLRSYVAEVSGSTFGRKDAAQQTGALYAAVLANLRLRDVRAARALLEPLGVLVKSDPSAARLRRLLTAEVELTDGNAAAAANLLKDERLDRRPELLLFAQASSRAGQPDAAADRLQTWVALHPRDAAAWLQLAAARGVQGERLRSLRAEAEARVAQFDYPAAVDRFRAAQDVVRAQTGGGNRSPAEHIEASIIDTRLRQVQSIVREQALER